MNWTSEATPILSVFIRVRNEAMALDGLLRRLASQRLDVKWETVVLDNASDDDSAATALAAGARVFILPRHQFGFGRALNLGMELCRGDYVLPLSAHAWPQGENWLQTMLDTLRTDPSLGAAYCRQVPLHPLSRQELLRYRVFAPRSHTVRPDDLPTRTARGEDPYEVCCFSNSASIVRRDVALECPFRDLPYAEDRAFALDVLLHGFSVAYVSDVAVAYERAWSFRSLYHVGRRAQAAKHLIREIAMVGLGRRMRQSELTSRGGRMLLKPFATLARVLGSPLVDRQAPVRACRYALASWGTTVGMFLGELTWRRYRTLAGCDAPALLEALRKTYAFHLPVDESRAATGCETLTGENPDR